MADIYTSQQKITGAVNNARHGAAVAVSGDTLVVGAPTEDASSYGAVYIYTRSGASWSLQQRLVSASRQGEYFGTFVGIDDIDQNTIVIGAPYWSAALTQVGTAYIFTRSGGVWTQRTQLYGSDGANYILQGPCSIHNGTAVLGCLGRAAAYVFTGSGASWSQQQKITHAGMTQYPSAVAVQNDTIALGTPGGGSNSVHVFTRTAGTWSLQQKLTVVGDAANPNFGTNVDLDGDNLIAGAQWGGTTYAGTAYVFTRSGASWTQQQKLVASDPTDYSLFGSGVSIEGDVAVVGAYRKASYTGAVYAFSRTGGVWTEQQKISGEATNDRFGASDVAAVINGVSISGNTLVVGAERNTATLKGSAYVYTSASGTDYTRDHDDTVSAADTVVVTTTSSRQTRVEHDTATAVDTVASEFQSFTRDYPSQGGLDGGQGSWSR